MAVVTEIGLDIRNMLPVTFTAPGLTEAQFLKLCEEFPDALLEYTADGRVIVMPPTGFESGECEAEVVRQLKNWAIETRRGRVSGPTAGFFFPDGSRLSPDAAWCHSARWEAAKRPDLRFPPFAPDFVIEVRSPQQRARPLHKKMLEYIANGVKLGWLIDPIERTVTIYRPGREPEAVSHPASVAGEGPVAGFVLQLERIFS
jgi:Uma2 family endonuclease